MPALEVTPVQGTEYALRPLAGRAPPHPRPVVPRLSYFIRALDRHLRVGDKGGHP